MKKVLCFLMITLMAGTVMAQPKARRQQQAQKRQQTAATTAATAQNQGLSQRARLMYPTSLDMPEDVVWRRDLYREINLNDEANSGLYYPVEPIDKKMNLFTYIFKLALNGYIPIYEYRLDGNESFSDSSKVAMKTLLDNYHIFYETRDNKLRVENSDIPSAEVKMYYLKESAYYDQSNAQFRRKVMALCPVMMREDDFGGEAAKYPLFWVKYEDIAPFLSKQTIMTSNLNNAATMSVDDYFTKNMYRGKIYKTTNMLGKTLAQYCTDDSAMTKEQKRIEMELAEFEKNIWGDQQRKDSLDSIANTSDKKVKKKRNRRDGTVEVEQATVKKRRSSSSSSGGSGSQPRVSVRRQRH